MTPELRDWLLDCPELTAVSALAFDAGSCGLVDLWDAVPRAVAVHVRLQTSYLLHPQRLLRARFALAQARRLKACRIDIANGVAIVTGPIAPGAVVAEIGGQALLEIGSRIPETVAVAMSGRLLTCLITSPVLDRRPYVVLDAKPGEDSTILRIHVPTIPIVRIRACPPRLSRAS